VFERALAMINPKKTFPLLAALVSLNTCSVTSSHSLPQAQQVVEAWKPGTSVVV
jgi:hypothetical protein